MRYRAILFDLDGTLVDSLPSLVVATNGARAELGHPPLTAEQVGACVGNGLLNLVKRSVPEEDPDEIMPTFRKHYDASLLPYTSVYDGVPETLAELKEMGCRMGVVTNKVEESAEHVLDHIGIGEYFGVVAGGNGVRALKPAAEPFEYSLAELGATVSEALMVGDAPPDIQGARAVGIPTCAVTYGIGSVEQIRALNPDHLIERFAELLGVVRT